MSVRSIYQLLCGVIITPLLFVGGSFAIVTSVTDCNEYSHTSAAEYAKNVQEKFKDKEKSATLRIFKEEDLTTAMRHLHQACCEGYVAENDEKKQGLLKCTTLNKLRPLYPESPFLYDHLVNIGMRKLDGVQQHCDELRISCEMADSTIKTKEWREKITEIAEDTRGISPSVIEGLFRTYRGDRDTFTSTSTSVIAQAYQHMCKEIEHIREEVRGVNESAGDATFWGKGGVEGACENSALFRYNQEQEYVRILMVEKGTEYLMQNLREYMFDHFIKNRFVNLSEKYGSLESCLSTVLNYTTNTPCCNE